METVKNQKEEILEKESEAVKNELELTDKQLEDQEVALRIEKNALRLLDMKRFEESLEFFRRSVTICKQFNDRESLGRLAYQMGFAYEQQQKFNEAITCYKESKSYYSKVGNKENYCISADRLGKIYYTTGRVEDSVNEFRDAIEFGGASSEIYNNLAFLQIEREEFDEARKNLEESLSLREKEESEESHISYNNLGIIEYIKGNFKEAETFFGKGVEVDNRPEEDDRAIQYLVFVKPEFKGEKFPTYKVFQDVYTKACMTLNLAAAKASQGKKDEALALVDKAIDMDRESGYVYEAAGWLHLSLKDEAKALENFKRALPYDHANENLNKVLDLINPYLNAKVGRNDPCPCGSGKKFKKCHGAEV